MRRYSNIFFFPLIIFGFISHAQHAQSDTAYIDELIERNVSSAIIDKKAFDQSQKILQLSVQAQYAKGASYALRYIANYYLKFDNNYSQAIATYQQLWHIGDSLGKQVYIQDAYLGLGKVYDAMNRPEKAIEYFQKIDEINKVVKDKECTACTLNSLGILLSKKGEYAAALEYFMRAKKLVDAAKNPRLVHQVDNNIGIAYIYLNQPDKAISIFTEQLNIMKETKDTLKFPGAYGNLAFAYQHASAFKQAFAYYDSSIRFSTQLKMDEATYITYLDMSGAYQSKKDYERALEAYIKHQEVKDRVLSEKRRKQIAELEVKFETEQKERDLMEAQQDLDQLLIARQRLYLVVGGLFVGFIAVVFAVFMLKKDHQRKQKLLLMNEELAKEQLKNKELKEQQLQAELQNKEADMTDLALDISRKNDFSQQLIKQLNALQKSEKPDLQQNLTSIISFINNHLRTNDDLALLQANTDKINKTFYDKLEKQFGKLSPNEKYILGLIRLNLSNKEIASIKGISPNSAKVMRYRLRKKLELRPEVDFAEFLKGI